MKKKTQKFQRSFIGIFMVMILCAGLLFSNQTTVEAAGRNTSQKITKISMTAGQSRKLKISGAKRITWKTSKKSVVTVSKKGRVKAKKKGTAVITAKFTRKNKTRTKKWRITVKARKTASKKTQNKTTEKRSDETPAKIPEKTDSDSTETKTPDTTTEAPDENTGSDSEIPQASNILVAYFSWSGTSEKIANDIAAQTGADLFRIDRETPYSDDYYTVGYGDAKTEAETNAKPPLKDPLPSVAQYNKIILCYPIWWHTAPMTVGTFLESYDFTGKYVYPVSQSASMDVSQYEQSVAFIKECAKNAIVDDGIFTKNSTEISNYITNTVKY